MTSEVPSWLNSLCSQSDIFIDVSLPQIFTPRDQPGEQQLCSKSQAKGESDYHSQYQQNNGRLQGNNVYPFVLSEPYLPPAGEETEKVSFNPSQPWPTLEPRAVPRKTDCYNNSKDFNNSRMHAPMDFSQPWPSCDVRNQVSMPHKTLHSSGLSSFRNTSLLKGKSLREYDKNGGDNSLCASLTYLQHAPPTVSPTVSPRNVSRFPSSSISPRRLEPQPHFKKPATTFAVPNPKPALPGANVRGQKTGFNPEPRPTTPINSMDRTSTNGLTRNPHKTAQQNDKNYTPNRNDFSRMTDVSSDTKDGRVNTKVNSAFMVRGCSTEAGKDRNPFTPATINFSGIDGKGTKLRSVEEIPTPYRDIFTFPFFNAVQSLAFDKLLYTDGSLVMSAPTGSGKTALFELAMVRLLLSTKVPLQEIKIVYIAPMKSLCGERVDDWRQKLSPYGLQCLELTGDSDLNDFTSLHHVQLICTTPEKWDSVTRRWKDNRRLFQSICLVCVDEVHTVGDSQRGATVEAVITRMKMVRPQSAAAAAAAGQPIRFVAVSATLPNTEDIAEWLSSKSNPALVYKLGEEYRPVKLQRVVQGYPFTEGSSEFRFDLNLTYKLHPLIDSYCDGKPTLVFCSSRKSCQQTAETLVKRRWGHSSYVMPQFRQEINAAASRIREKKLSDLVSNGVGVHHAGLDVQDRKLVEDLFRCGKLAVLISTSTLSVGVNLPAHLVIVKATHMYVMGAVREYSDQQVLQMIGRAGRPQFDTSATVVIMTKSQLKGKYENLVNGTQVIESMLHKNLTEHVNVEVVLNTITDMADAASWLSNTLLHVRATKNPRHYGLPSGLSTQQVEKKLQELCMIAINRLNSLQLVTVDPDTTITSPTDRGRLMARYCLEFQTVKLFSELPAKSSLEDVIKVVADCSEFQDVQLRMSERKTLNALNKNKLQETIKYPMQGKIKTKQMKVNCLIQAALGCLHVQDYSLSQDLQKIFRVGQRITKCLMELQWLGGDHTTLLSSLNLCKAFKARLWPDSKHVARQLEGIGPTISQALVLSGLTSFQQLEATQPGHLEMVVNRHPPFGSRVLDAVTHLPRYELIIQQAKSHKAASALLVISVSVLNAEEMTSSSTCGSDHQMVILVGDQDNTIVFKWRLSDRMLLSQVWSRKIQVKRAVAGSTLHIALISQDWVGLDIHTQYEPAYTTSLHPAGPVGPTQPQGQSATVPSRLQQGKRNRAEKADKAKGEKPGGQSKGDKPSKIQQQLDLMQSKLQQFQRTAPQKLTHDRNFGSTPSSSVMSRAQGIQDPTKRHHPGNTPALDPYQGRTTPATGFVSDLPLPTNENDGALSPEFDLQAEPWGDFVTDFFEEDNFDEPPSKAPKIMVDPRSIGAARTSGSKVSKDISMGADNSCVTFHSQPDVRVFGDTQQTSQVHHRPTRTNETPSRRHSGMAPPTAAYSSCSKVPGMAAVNNVRNGSLGVNYGYNKSGSMMAGQSFSGGLRASSEGLTPNAPRNNGDNLDRTSDVKIERLGDDYGNSTVSSQMSSGTSRINKTPMMRAAMEMQTRHHPRVTDTPQPLYPRVADIPQSYYPRITDTSQLPLLSTELRTETSADDIYRINTGPSIKAGNKHATPRNPRLSNNSCQTPLVQIGGGSMASSADELNRTNTAPFFTAVDRNTTPQYPRLTNRYQTPQVQTGGGGVATSVDELDVINTTAPSFTAANRNETPQFPPRLTNRHGTPQVLIDDGSSMASQTPHYPRVVNTTGSTPNPPRSGWEDLQLFRSSREQVAAVKPRSDELGEEGMAEGRGGSKPAGSGWEDLMLYQSNREACLLNQGDTQESSDGAEDSGQPSHQSHVNSGHLSTPRKPMISSWRHASKPSTPRKPISPWQHDSRPSTPRKPVISPWQHDSRPSTPRNPVISPWQHASRPSTLRRPLTSPRPHPGHSLVGSTSSMGRDVDQTSCEGHWHERKLYDPHWTNPEHLLEGIF